MPQYPDIFYHCPYFESVQTTDTVIVADTLACTDAATTFVTEGFGRAVVPMLRATYDVLHGWDLVILALALLLVVLNKQLFPRQFRQVLGVPGGVAHTNQLLREWSPMRSFLGVSFVFAYILVISVFIQKSVVVVTRDIQRYNSLGDFAAIASCVAGWVLVRHMVLRFVNWMLDTKDAIDRQLAVQLSLSILTLLPMLPVVLLLLYNPYSMFVRIGAGIIVLAALARFVYGFVETRVAIKTPSLFIFLYFCALEIAPMALLLTACMRYISHGSVF